MAKKKVVELPTREELVALATEVNAVLNLEAPIKFGKKVSDEDLIEAIKTNCTNNVYEIDFIEDPKDVTIPIYSEVQKEIFELLSIEILPGSPEAPEAEEDDEAPEEDEVPEPVKTKSVKDKKAEAKAAPAKAEKAAPAKDKKAEAKAVKYTRWTAFADVIKSGKTVSVSDIENKSDELYVKNGGTSNMDQSKKSIDKAIKVLLALGLGELDGKNFTYSV